MAEILEAGQMRREGGPVPTSDMAINHRLLIIVGGAMALLAVMRLGLYRYVV